MNDNFRFKNESYDGRSLTADYSPLILARHQLFQFGQQNSTQVQVPKRSSNNNKPQSLSHSTCSILICSELHMHTQFLEMRLMV